MTDGRARRRPHPGIGILRSYSLDRWVDAWKAYVSRRWPKEEDKSIWQRSFWDRQMWSDQTCDVKWLYVRNNPVRHGLVKHPDDRRFKA